MAIVYKSRIADALRQRRIGSVSDLRRRLKAKGYDISRSALDHLVSDKPVQRVDLNIVYPVLTELGIDFETAFVAEDQPPVTFEDRAAAKELARKIARGGSSSRGERRRRLTDADQELDAVADRLRQKLRHERPDLFDNRGRLRQRALTKVLTANNAGRTVLSGEDLQHLMEQSAALRAP